MPNNPNQALEQPNSSELEDIELHAQRIHNIRSRNLSLQEARILAILDHYRKLGHTGIPAVFLESVFDMLDF